MTGITIEHRQIIDWTQSRGGCPAIQHSSNLRRPVVRFSEEPDNHPVSWEEWMSVFDGDEWAFIYQDQTEDGEVSRSWKIVPRFARKSQ